MRRKLPILFIPLCGLFGGLAGQFLWGGGRTVFFGIGVGLIVGVVFRLFTENRRAK